MYDFHDNFIKRNFDANLLFTDTDSLSSEIKSKDLYEEFFKHKSLLDFSEHRPEFFDKTNKKVLGKMKDEFKGNPINKFIALKSNMYCIVSDDDTEVNTVKGVNITMEFIEYKNVLFNKKIIRHKMIRIQSKKLSIFS